MMASKPEPTVEFCQSYSTFKRDLKYHRGNVKKLNDKARTGSRSEQLGRDASAQSFRGTFVEIVATWEKYVQDILKETVEIVCTCLTEDKPGVVLTHPCSKEILRKVFKGPQPGEKTKQAEALEDYKQSLLKKCSRHLLPVFSGKDGIDNRFTSMFETTSSPSGIIIEMGPVNMSFMNQKRDKKNETMSLKTTQGIDDLLRLFYGVRCVYAHGNGDKTFQQGGVLYNFPEKEVFQERIGEDPGDQLYILYKYAKEYEKTAWVNYLDVVNLQRSILALAFRLFGAISKWVYDVFKVCIWNFDPDKVELNTKDKDDAGI